MLSLQGALGLSLWGDPRAVPYRGSWACPHRGSWDCPYGVTLGLFPRGVLGLSSQGGPGTVPRG